MVPIQGRKGFEEFFLYLWNLATKTVSNKIVFLHEESHLCKGGIHQISKWSLNASWIFWFGYHNSTYTYKIVAFYQEINEVKVFNMGDDVWRNIQNFPMSGTVNWLAIQSINIGVYVSDIVKWLAIRNEFIYNQFVMISLHLSIETYI